MAEGFAGDIDVSAETHGDMPFRLGDIALDKEFGDLHPILNSVDKLRHEWKFQFKLLKHEWGQPHVVTLLTGVVAFLLGSVSTDLFAGGDPKTTGLDGLAGIGGFAFFQIIISEYFGFGSLFRYR